MADPVLTSRQYSIGVPGDGGAFVYGGMPPAGANNIYVGNTAPDPGSATVQDQAIVGHDGIVFGIDTMPGMVITQTGYAMVAANGAAALDAYDSLASAWNAPGVRLVPNAIQVLRAWYPGATSGRRAYGRGRKIMPAMGLVNQGIVPFTAQFQAADDNWYSETQYSLTLTKKPSSRSGFTAPFTPPLQVASGPDYTTGSINNTGKLPTWPVISITGPIWYPGVTFLNTPVSVTYLGGLGISDTLVIDTRPWARTALLNNSGSLAGGLTGDPMISMQLQTGATTVRFNGVDFTGGAVLTVTWRNAYSAIGGLT